jgi:hypothetical protein
MIATDPSRHPQTDAASLAQATGRLPLVYFDHGYEAGYKQAVSDLLSKLVPLSEQFIDIHPGRAEELRKLLYPFEQYLEQRISRMSPDGVFVEDGLGI